MAGRIRSIKPELIDDQRVAGLSHEAFRLFIAGLCFADDYGVFRADTHYLKGQVFSEQPSRRPVDQVVAELEAFDPAKDQVCGLWVTYSVRGQRYGKFARWERHQKVNKPSAPRLPWPTDPAAKDFKGLSDEFRGSLGIPGIPPADQRPATSDHRPPTTSGRAPVPGGELQAKLELRELEPAEVFDKDLEAVYQLYPRKEGKKRGMALLRRAATSRARLGEVAQAVRNYADTVAGKEADYIKHFDTFMGCWEDYVDGSPVVAGDKLNHDSPPGDPEPPFLEPPEELYAMLTDDERANIAAHVERLKGHA